MCRERVNDRATIRWFEERLLNDDDDSEWQPEECVELPPPRQRLRGLAMRAAARRAQERSGLMQTILGLYDRITEIML